MIYDTIKALTALDPEIGGAVLEEYERQRNGLELIASENVVSEGVLLAAGTVMTNKYAEGYPGHRYYGGCEKVDVVKTSPSSAQRHCSARSMSTFSRIPVLRRIPPFMSRSCSPAIRSWA